jgi:Putative Flp pilus-assembly TadE/G-like
MLRLTRRLGCLAGADDHGGVAVLVVALLGGGVLLGMLALVIDVGRLLEERRELQNGADAAATSLARSCAENRLDCTAVTAPAVADSIADVNANDSLAAIDSVCGSHVALPACPPPGDSVYDCGPLPDSGTAFVEVRASTQTQSGRSIRALFADQDTTVAACSRAAWGSPLRSTGVAFTISLCEWQAATAGGTVYGPAPPYPPTPSPTYERVLYLHTTDQNTCTTGSGGLPGGFGWLEDDSGCETTVEAGGNYDALPGLGTRPPCKPALANARAARDVVFVPIYDDASGSGTNGTYHLNCFAAFVVTGYNLPGASAPSWLTGLAPCTGSTKCVSGFFTKDLVRAEGPLAPPGTDYGALIVRPIP